MVIFDILASHHRMLLWHESSVENLLKESADLQRAGQQAAGEPAESSNQAEQNGLEEGSQHGNEIRDTSEAPASSREECGAAPAEELQKANLPLDRR